MDFVKVTSGNTIYYIEKQQTAAILEWPSVLRVPEAQKEILGLFCYGGTVLPLYTPGAPGKFRCVVVVRPGIGEAFGIAAEFVEEEQMECGELTPVFSGVWGRTCDQAERKRI